ncbi:hypothetical protein V8E54_006942 [Elaphomyces granulatus]
MLMDVQVVETSKTVLGPSTLTNPVSIYRKQGRWTNFEIQRWVDLGDFRFGHLRLIKTPTLRWISNARDIQGSGTAAGSMR